MEIPRIEPFWADFQTSWSNPSGRKFFSQNGNHHNPTIFGQFFKPPDQIPLNALFFSQNSDHHTQPISGLFSDPRIEFHYTRIFFPKNRNSFIPTIFGPFSDPLIESLITHFFFSQNGNSKNWTILSRFSDIPIESYRMHIFFAKLHCQESNHFWLIFRHPERVSMQRHFFSRNFVIGPNRTICQLSHKQSSIWLLTWYKKIKHNLCIV